MAEFNFQQQSLDLKKTVTGSNPTFLVKRTYFSEGAVKTLKESDFFENSIRLKYDDCILVLFYVENDESINLATIWATAADQVAGPVFAACNCLVEKKVAQSFTRLASDRNDPNHWAALKGYPVILVYNRGWPQAFYRGERVTGSIIDFSMTLACHSDYNTTADRDQLVGSIQPSVNLGMTGIGKATPRANSTEFKATHPYRDYNASYPVAPIGSTQQMAIAEDLANKKGIDQPLVIPDGKSTLYGTPIGDDS